MEAESPNQRWLGIPRCLVEKRREDVNKCSFNTQKSGLFVNKLNIYGMFRPNPTSLPQLYFIKSSLIEKWYKNWG